MRKKCRFTRFRVPILSGTTILRRRHSQTRAFTPHHFPSYLNLQSRRATHVQVHLASRHPTPDATTHRSHGNRQVEPVNQAHIVEMQGGIRCPKGHFHHCGWWCTAHSPAEQLAGAVAGVACAFSGLVEVAALPCPNPPGPIFLHVHHGFLARAEVETAVIGCRMAGSALYSRPYALFAVVYQYELMRNPICIKIERIILSCFDGKNKK